MAIKIIVCGANGRMARSFIRIASQESDIKIGAGIDLLDLTKNGDFPMYLDAMEYGGEADVIVDFSVPDAADALIRCAVARKLPLVLCTTGYSAEQLDRIREASVKIPVFRSGNMSLGINLVAGLVRRTARVLGEGFDVEILERHHRRKVDAPSGTALMLADAAAAGMADKPEYVYDRSGRREPRPAGEIGLSAVRGGTIVGEHEVIFAGTDEVIEIRHTAYSRDVFAVGAVKAAKHMAAVTAPGLYDMTDVLALDD